MSAVTPYDFIICFVLWVILCAAALIPFCVKRYKGETLRKQANPEDPNSPAPEQQPAQSETDSYRRMAITFVIGLAIVGLCFAVAYLLTCVIFAIMGSTSILSSLLFSPKAADTCTGSCAYTTRDGLSGWVDEECCDYAENVGQRDVWIQFGSSSAQYVHGWLMVNTTARFAGQRQQAVLYFHGSGGNVAMGYRLERYRYLLGLGNIAIFVFDYAGYGKSTGDADADDVMNSAEAAAAWFAAWERGGWDVNAPMGTSQAPLQVTTANLDFSRLVILGRSMGGAVSTYIGSHRRTQWTARALVLQSTFSSPMALTFDYFPLCGWVWALQVEKKFPEFITSKNVQSFARCLYEAHSKTDEWVKFEHAERIQAETSKKDPACSVFVTVTQAEHTQPLTQVERTSLTAFLDARR